MKIYIMILCLMILISSCATFSPPVAMNQFSEEVMKLSSNVDSIIKTSRYYSPETDSICIEKLKKEIGNKYSLYRIIKVDYHCNECGYGIRYCYQNIFNNTECIILYFKIINGRNPYLADIIIGKAPDDVIEIDIKK